MSSRTELREEEGRGERPGSDVEAEAARSTAGAPSTRDLDDEDEDEIAPPGNRRSEPPTSGAPEERAAQRGDQGRRGGRGGRRGGGAPGSPGGGQGGGGQGGGGRGAGPRAKGTLPEDDPFWQFGTPVELWGSTRAPAPRGPRKKGDAGGGRSRYHECRTCGIKIEARRSVRGSGKVACPSCGRWMDLR